MKIRIETGRYWYKDLVGQEFDVIEKFDLLYKDLYLIKGRENESKGNWFSKKDCMILDEDYLKALEILQIEERLNYCKTRLEECREKLRLYDSGEYKEEFPNQTAMLTIGVIAKINKIKGQIEILESLLGIIEI